MTKPKATNPKPTKTKTHRLSVSTKTSSRTLDSEATKVNEDDEIDQTSIAHKKKKSAKPKSAMVVEDDPAEERSNNKHRLLCGILLAKIEQGNKCDWFALSEKFKEGQDIAQTKKGKKGKKGLEALKAGGGLSGNDLHEIYYNTILPGLQSGIDFFLSSPPPADTVEPESILKKVKPAKKRNLDDLSDKESKVSVKVTKKVAKRPKQNETKVEDKVDNQSATIAKSKKVITISPSREKKKDTRKGGKGEAASRVDESMKSIIEEFLGDSEADMDDRRPDQEEDCQDDPAEDQEDDTDDEDDEGREKEDEEKAANSQVRTQSWIDTVQRIAKNSGGKSVRGNTNEDKVDADQEEEVDELDVMDEEVDKVGSGDQE